jgi:hypothetical protein
MGAGSLRSASGHRTSGFSLVGKMKKEVPQRMEFEINSARKAELDLGLSWVLSTVFKY